MRQRSIAEFCFRHNSSQPSTARHGRTRLKDDTAPPSTSVAPTEVWFFFFFLLRLHSTFCTPHARRGRREGCSASASWRKGPERDVVSPSWLRWCAQDIPKERRSQGALQGATQPFLSLVCPPRAGGSAELRRAKGALSRLVTDKVVRFRPPTSADLRGQHDQAQRAWASELRVTSLLTPCNVDGSPVSFRRCRLRAPVGAQRRDQGHVTAEGLSTPGRAIDDEVQPASVIWRHTRRGAPAIAVGRPGLQRRLLLSRREPMHVQGWERVWPAVHFGHRRRGDRRTGQPGL